MRNAAPTMALLRLEELNNPARMLFVERESDDQFHERDKMSKLPTENSKEKVSKNNEMSGANTESKSSKHIVIEIVKGATTFENSTKGTETSSSTKNK